MSFTDPNLGLNYGWTLGESDCGRDGAAVCNRTGQALRGL